MTHLEKEIKEFADAKFGPRTVASRLRKLGEEFGELAEAVAIGDELQIKLEAADLGIVLSDLLIVLGEGHSLYAIMATKLDIVRERDREAAK